MKKSQRGFIVPFLITVIVVLIASFILYLYLQNNKKPEIKNTQDVNSLNNAQSDTSVSIGTSSEVAPIATSTKDSFVNDGTKIPKIYSINPKQTDHQGTVLTIKGIYLNGFEGGTAIWFENETGQSGVIETNSYVPAGATTLTITLPNQLCTKSLGESGLPCSSYVGMRPGLYKVYVKPWSVISNKLDFMIKQ